jgi:hypothetical protein
MNNRSAILMAFGACGVGFLAAWLIFRSDGTCTIDERGTPRELGGLERISQEQRAMRDVQELERPDSRLPVSTETAKPLEDSPSDTMTTPEAKHPMTESQLRAILLPIPNTPPEVPSPNPSALPEATLDEMLKKRNSIQALLVERSTPLLNQRFDDSLSKLMSGEGVFASYPELDRIQIHAERTVAGQGVYRAALPRADYPELYALHDEVARLDKLVRGAQRREHEKKHPQ